MTKRPFTKPAKTYSEQVEILRSRGMIIPDEKLAEFYLQHLNYYRLGAYWLPFESNHNQHQFKEGTTFEQVLTLYRFDRELRLILYDAIERVEISARAQWAYAMGHQHGPHAHLESQLASNYQYWQRNKDDLKKEVDRADEIFIRHFTETYQEELPPVWAICEVMSMGLLSRWYSNLRPMRTRKQISRVYNLDHAVFASWLHHLSVVRNVCAHHSRLWNRSFRRIAPKTIITYPHRLKSEFIQSNKLYNTIIILLYLMDIVSPNHHWRSRLIDLLQQYTIVPLDAMGFPMDWEMRPIMNNSIL